MERLWAPWRMAYILGEEKRAVPSGCIFCDLPAQGEEHFRENLILSCGERIFLIMNRYPYNNAHLMAVPRAHVATPADLSEGDHRRLAELVRRAVGELRQALKPDGMNVGMNLGRTAGAGIADHCHYHLVPRWDGDTNFMPVIGEAKVISEGLLQTYDRLRPLLAGLAPKIEEELG